MVADHMDRVEPDAIAARLRIALGSRSVWSVAQATGLERRTIRACLRGDCKRGSAPRVYLLLAQALNVRPEWLAFGIEP